MGQYLTPEELEQFLAEGAREEQLYMTETGGKMHASDDQGATTLCGRETDGTGSYGWGAEGVTCQRCRWSLGLEAVA